MRRSRSGGSRGIATAALVVLVGAFLAFLCFQAAVGNMLAEGDTTLVDALPDDSDAVLSRATEALVRRYGHLDAATLDAVRRASMAAPLDARPYLILGHQQLLDRQPARALATLEAGQRLDPRQPLIHVLLLDRYLRTARYTDAAAQMSVLTRTVGSSQSPIAVAFASMLLAPQTREAAQRTLRTDPVLEQSVLVALANGGVAPATIFALASPAALTEAGEKDGWGVVLVNQLVAQHRYVLARSVWQRVYHLAAPDLSPIFNGAFRSLPATPPFNWALEAGSIGASELKGGGLAIDYYGRDSGNMATQLLVLRPGAWRFGFTVDPGKSDAGSQLVWSLTCVGGEKAFMTTPIVAGPSSHHRSVDFVVPAGCPAQQLAIRGEAGDLPVPTSVTIRAPEMISRTETRP